MNNIPAVVVVEWAVGADNYLMNRFCGRSTPWILPTWTMSWSKVSNTLHEIRMRLRYSTGEVRSTSREGQSLLFILISPIMPWNAMFCPVRVISENGNGPPVFVDDLLSTLTVPLMLLWGIKDPWIRPQAAERIQVRLLFKHTLVTFIQFFSASTAKTV